jgi:hypothetical protein
MTNVKILVTLRSAFAGLTAIVLLFLATAATAQESSPKPGGGSSAPLDPTAALRDILSAACSQSQNDFARFLTARNKESFSRLAAAARIAFMKRFVLLNEPGKPSVTTNPSGRLIVRCETPAGAAEIQIGRAEAEDNIAFLSVQLHDAADSVAADAISVKMGLVRENGEWKILSLGLVLLDLPSLEAEWDSAESGTNEEAAIESLKKIAGALEDYRLKYLKLPETLAALGPPLHGEPNAQAAALVDSELAAGMKNGYSFRYVILGGSALGAPAKFELAATPLNYGRTGHRSFFLDSQGALHGADRRGAVGSEADPKVQ